MKTRIHRSQRKQTRLSSRRRVVSTSIKEAPPERETPQPEQQQDTAILLSPLELLLGNAQICGDGMNLIRSEVSDDEGTYLVMSIEVPAPFTAAYDAWIRFDDIPHFMRGRNLPETCDGSRMTWRIRTLFDQFAWQAKVCDQVPFESIAWKSVQGTPHPGFGSVSFEPIGHLRTLILVQVGFDMSGLYRWLGDPLPSLSRSLEQSLKRFHGCMAAFQSADEMEAQPRCVANAVE